MPDMQQVPEDLDTLVEASSRPLQVVVVGLDVAELDRAGAQPSRHAAAHAIGLARREGPRLVGVWVRPHVSYVETFAETVETISRRRHEAETELRERAAEADEHFGLPPGSILVREGHPGPELLAAASEVGADAIIVGASIERVGSVASYLIRHARVPVTVVP